MDWNTQYYHNAISPCPLKLIYSFNTITKMQRNKSNQNNLEKEKS